MIDGFGLALSSDMPRGRTHVNGALPAVVWPETAGRPDHGRGETRARDEPVGSAAPYGRRTTDGTKQGLVTEPSTVRWHLPEAGLHTLRCSPFPKRARQARAMEKYTMARRSGSISRLLDRVV
jgi:hypothetical protein